MKVEDVIEALLNYPLDMEIEIWQGYDPGCGLDSYAELEDLHVNEEGKLTFQ